MGKMKNFGYLWVKAEGVDGIENTHMKSMLLFNTSRIGLTNKIIQTSKLGLRHF